MKEKSALCMGQSLECEADRANAYQKNPVVEYVMKEVIVPVSPLLSDYSSL